MRLEDLEQRDVALWACWIDGHHGLGLAPCRFPIAAFQVEVGRHAAERQVVGTERDQAARVGQACRRVGVIERDRADLVQDWRVVRYLVQSFQQN